MDPIREARHAANGKWMERAAVLGLIARGVIHAIIGASALLLAFGEGGRLLDSEQATKEVQRQPGGDTLLIALGIGLACYGLWRIAQGAFGHSKLGDSKKKIIAKRIGHVGKGLIHLALAVSAFQSAAGDRDTARDSWVHRVIAWEGGRWILVAIGIGFMGAGAHQLYRAFTAKFRKELDTGRMSAREETWAIRIGRFGMAARGVVLPIIGWLLVRAGLQSNADGAKGTDGALYKIATGTGGDILLPIIAAGLISYALYMFVHARYHGDLMRA